MADHCERLPKDFRGRPVSLIPQLQETLVLLSADEATRINASFWSSASMMQPSTSFRSSPRSTMISTIRMRPTRSRISRTWVTLPGRGSASVTRS